MTRFWEPFIEQRDLFVSKRCRYTYSGYAIAQLKRIKTHRKFLLDPPKKAPVREEYGLRNPPVFPTSQLKAVVSAALEFIIEEEKQDFLDELDRLYGDYLIPLYTRFLVPEHRRTAMEWLQAGIKAQANTFISLGDNYLKDEYVEEAKKEVTFYEAQRDWDRYCSWKKSRNKARAELEEKHGFDCYSDDTEFLTESGWKFYDDIKETDKLATLKTKATSTLYKLAVKTLIQEEKKKNTYIPECGIEYQKFIDRYEAQYTGSMYHFFGTHLDLLVTPNHRMLCSIFEKNTKKRSELSFTQAALLPNSFSFLNHATPVKKNYSNKKHFDGIPINPAAYMSLMGWFLSDGTFITMKNKKVKTIRISQKKGNRLHWFMSRFNNKYSSIAKSSLYSYQRETLVEMVLDIREKGLVEKLYNDCGHSHEKHIPEWVFGLSQRLKEKLIDAMCLGDGTIRNTSLKTLIYYSKSKKIADGINRLCVTAGYESSVWGPYPNETSFGRVLMYQVHINKNPKKYDHLCRSKNVKKIDVDKKRIVCFTVPNETLIVRRNGKVSFQGNSKHAAHLVRLMRMGMEILETGKVNVDRTDIDAEELKAIRNGAWSYEEVEQYANDSDKKLVELYNKSKLKKSPDVQRIGELCVSTVDSFFS
jgi:hypothetical protein